MELSRSLGGRAWRDPALPRSVLPTCFASKITYDTGCMVLVLASSPVASRLSPDGLCDVVRQLEHRPRAISGELVAKTHEEAATSSSSASSPGQHSAVTVFFYPPREIPED